jgi:DNA-directed RNA polymerase specialized sigma24 family protein
MWKGWEGKLADPDKTDALSKFLADHEASLLSGEGAAFHNFALLLYPVMEGYFIRKFKFEVDVARSLATDVVFKIWRIIGDPKRRPDSLTPGYIYTTAYTIGIDYTRLKQPQEQPIPEGFEPASEQNPESSLLSSFDVNEEALNPKQLRCLHAFHSIKERYQVILRMRYGEEEKSIEEIAIALNLKESSARLLLWRAQKAAKKKWDEDKGP